MAQKRGEFAGKRHCLPVVFERKQKRKQLAVVIKQKTDTRHCLQIVQEQKQNFLIPKQKLRPKTVG
jgi:hypothetical protein